MPTIASVVASLVAACALSAAPVSSAAPPNPPQDSQGFAERIAALSEGGGTFEADNLVSNERSYLHVLSTLRDTGVTGGAYIGVGPDQNFSYIARIRPTIAFIVDIRRDNLLLHLLFKALFSMSSTRVAYMSQLFGRPVPEPLASWQDADVMRLVGHIDGTLPTPEDTERLRARTDVVIRSFGVPLSAEDMATIDRFHRAFIARGLSLRFEVTGRVPLPGYYPSYRDLLVETDREGHLGNFLAAESDFQFVKGLEARDLVIPVVGDLGGTKALPAIGDLLTARGERVSAFYASNVEFYLSGSGTFRRFLDNLARLPRTPRSVLIRAIFGGYILPQSVPGYTSTSLVQGIKELLDGFSTGKYQGYDDLLMVQ